MALLSGCAQQWLRDKATAQMRDGHYEAAVKTLDEGVARHPDSALLRSGLVSARGEAMSRLVTQASQARTEGRLDATQALLERALALEPGNTRVKDLMADLNAARAAQAALQSARQQRNAGDRSAALRTLRAALLHAPRQPDLLELLRDIEREERLAGVPAAQVTLVETRLVSLDFRNAPLSILLEAIRDGGGDLPGFSETLISRKMAPAQ